MIASPAVAGGRVYFSTADTGLFHAFDAKDRRRDLLPRFQALADVFLARDCRRGRPYIGSHSGRLLAIDLKAHALAWAFETEASKTNGPALTLADGTPNYAAAFTEDFYDNLIVGFSKMMTTGAMLSSPAIAGGVVYVGFDGWQSLRLGVRRAR